MHLTRCLLGTILVIAFAGIAGPAFADDFTQPGGDTPPQPQPDPDDPGDGGCEGADPVQLHDGGFVLRRTDLTISGRIPIRVTRTYDSRSDLNGLFGYGWTLSYHMRLRPLADGSFQLLQGDHSKLIYTDLDEDDTYTGDSLIFSTVRDNGDGTFTLWTIDGMQYVFDIDGRLTTIEDLNGNQLLLSYDPAGLLPINGISKYAPVSTKILIAMEHRLTRIEEAHAGTPSGRYVDLLYDSDGRITSITDFTGRQVTYEYDPTDTGDLLMVIDAESNEHDYTYDGDHHMLTFVGQGCAECSLHTNEYDADGRAVRQTHGNSIITFEYQAGPRTVMTTEVYDDTTLALLHTRYEYYDYDANDRLTKLTRQLGGELDETPGSTETDDVVRAFDYDPNTGQFIQETGARSATIAYTYHAATGKRLTRTVTAPGGTDWLRIAYTYDAAPHHRRTSREITASFDPRTYRDEYVYDAAGNRLEYKRLLDDTPTYVTTTYTYDGFGDRATRTDSRGNVMAYERDPYGFVTREYDPAGPNHETNYTYDTLGNRISVTNALGGTTTFEYDHLRRLTKQSDPFGQATDYTYVGADLMQIDVGDPADGGQTVKLDYDVLHRLTAVKMVDDGGGDVTLETYGYDSEGRLLKTTDGNGNSVTRTYDLLGRLAGLSDDLSNTVTFTHDKHNNLVTVLDAESNSTTYVYDFLDRRTGAEDALTHVTSYARDALANVTSLTNANLKTTTFTYDRLGRLTQEANPLGHITQYGYDGNGNLISKVTPNEYAGAQRPIVYQYDAHNRLRQIDYPGGSKTVTLGYDIVDNLTSWDDGTLSGTAAYDLMQRPVSVTTNYPGFSKPVTYAYDLLGRVTTVRDGERNPTHYEYSALDRLRLVRHPAALVTEYTYDIGGRPAQKILPNGVAATYTFDVADRLTNLVNDGPGGAVSSYAYTHDNMGNRLTMTTPAGVHNYGYDDTYQLTSATHPEPVNPAESYSYDPLGNRLTSADHSDWDYDDGNRLLSYNGVSFTYDESGNTTSMTDANGMTTYVFDHDNRLIQATTPAPDAHVATYEYDPFGRRVTKTVDGTTTYFLYDREDIIADYDAAGTVQKHYFYGQGIDEPVALVEGALVFSTADFDRDGDVDVEDLLVMEDCLLGSDVPHDGSEACQQADLGIDGDVDLRDLAVLQQQAHDRDIPNAIRYYSMDGLGSVTGLTDSAGTIEVTYTYDAFGNIVDQVGTGGNRYTYTGRERDDETGLYHYRLRDYAPAAGRFQEPDPLGLTFDANVYRYVSSNPVNLVDPMGLWGRSRRAIARGLRRDIDMLRKLMPSFGTHGGAGSLARYVHGSYLDILLSAIDRQLALLEDLLANPPAGSRAEGRGGGYGSLGDGGGGNNNGGGQGGPGNGGGCAGGNAGRACGGGLGGGRGFGCASMGGGEWKCCDTSGNCAEGCRRSGRNFECGDEEPGNGNPAGNGASCPINGSGA